MDHEPTSLYNPEDRVPVGQLYPVEQCVEVGLFVTIVSMYPVEQCEKWDSWAKYDPAGTKPSGKSDRLPLQGWRE